MTDDLWDAYAPIRAALTHAPGTMLAFTIIDGDGNRLDVVGRATGVPGLVANRAPALPDEWGITHQRSGVSLGWWTSDPELAIRFAHEVSNLMDRTARAADIVAATGLSSAVNEAGERLGLWRGGTPRKGPVEDLT